MYVQIGGKALADFRRPIEMMMDCHRRVEHFFSVLQQVAERNFGGPLEAEDRQALETALNYFASAAPRHHEDEEQSLFLRLRRSGDPRAMAAIQKVDQLEVDHADAAPLHARVQALGRAWLAGGSLNATESNELINHVRRLAELYARHIQMEDREVFPLALQVLSPQQLADIGREMEERRIVNPGRETSRCGQRRRAAQEVSPPLLEEAG